MSKILALDPGTTETGWVLYNGGRVAHCGVMANQQMVDRLSWSTDDGTVLAVEMIASYGMPVGKEVFETCVWIGRFLQAWHRPDLAVRVFRQEVKLHLCGSPKAKDPNVRQALLDQFPATGGGAVPQVGTKKKPGPLFGVSSHIWSALGVAVTVAGRTTDAAALAPAPQTDLLEAAA